MMYSFWNIFGLYLFERTYLDVHILGCTYLGNTITHTHTHGGARGVTVIVEGNGHVDKNHDQDLNPGRD